MTFQHVNVKLDEITRDDNYKEYNNSDFNFPELINGFVNDTFDTFEGNTPYNELWHYF